MSVNQPGKMPTEVWDLGASIIREFAPGEVEDYSLLVGTYAQADLLAPSTKHNSDRFGFGVPFDSVLISAHILQGMLALFEIFVTSRRIKQEIVTIAQFKSEWTELLVSRGLSKELAESIPLRHAAEMLEILKRESKNIEQK